MAGGTLGAMALEPNENTVLFTTPVTAKGFMTVNICFANRSRGETAEAYIYITPDAVTDASCFEPGGDIPPRGSLERYGVAISSGDKVVVRTTGSSVTARIHGM